MVDILQIHKSFPILWNQLESTRRNHHSHKCGIIEKHGNIEVGIERMGGEMGYKL